jgi:O-methyltransferase
MLSRVTPADLYLNLLKRTLTRFDLGDDRVRVIGTRYPTGRWIMERLAGHNIEVVRVRAFDAEVRSEGRDWPADAETMIGLKRLDNLQYCVTSVISDGIPGDLLEAGVWRGGACIFMRGVLIAHGIIDRSVWVADSFRGLPPPDPSVPADSGDKHYTFSELAISLEEVKANFAKIRVA